MIEVRPGGQRGMPHLLYEILMEGEGDLVEKGGTLNAASPWLESVTGVPVEDSTRAKYVYVARHRASCFASCVDFVADNLGASAPPMDAGEAWFRSAELMGWGSWPSHVSFFARGTADRHLDVPEAVRGRIMDWCRGQLASGPLPFDDLDPEAAPQAPA